MAEWKKLVVEGANITTEALVVTEAAVDAASDSIVFSDKSDSDKLKRDTVVDVVAAVAGEGLQGQSDGTIDLYSGGLGVLTNSSAQASTDVLLVFDGGTGSAGTLKTITISEVAAAAAEDTNTTYALSAADGGTDVGNVVLTDSGGDTDTVTITAGDGLSIQGSGSNIGITPVTDDTTLQVVDTGTSGQIKVKNAGIDTAQLADEAVSSQKTDFIEDSVAVTANKILVANGTEFQSVTMSGDATLATDGAITVAFGANTVTDLTGGTNISVSAATGSVTVNLDDDIDLAGTLDVTATGTFDANVIIQGDLTVNGTTVTVNATDLAVEDRFITLNNGGAAADTGIIFDGQGAALGWDESAGRMAFDIDGNAAGTNALPSSPDAYLSMVVTSADANFQYNGNIRVDGGNIYIYVES